MAKKAPDYKVCPACDSRNKPSWEYCARCGEALPAATVNAPASRQVPTGDASPGMPIAPFIAIPLFLLAAVYVFRSYRGEVQAPPPGLFAVPTEGPAGSPAGPVRTLDARLLEAQGKIRSGDGEGALSILSPLLSERPDDPDVHGAQAHALWITGKREVALDELRRAADLSPANALGYRTELARALATLERSEDALREYRVLVDQRGSVADLKEIAALYVKVGRSQEAVPLLAKASQGTSSDVTLLELAMMLEKAGATDQARDVFQKILENRPDSDVVRLQLAEALYRGNQATQAEQVVREGITRTPEQATLHRGLGSLLERTGRSGEAAQAYREYLRLAPQASDAKDIADRSARLEGRASS